MWDWYTNYILTIFHYFWAYMICMVAELHVYWCILYASTKFSHCVRQTSGESLWLSTPALTLWTQRDVMACFRSLFLRVCDFLARQMDGWVQIFFVSSERRTLNSISIYSVVSILAYRWYWTAVYNEEEWSRIVCSWHSWNVRIILFL